MDVIRQLRDFRNNRIFLQLQRKPYSFKRRHNPFILLSENKFRKRYRLSKNAAQFIVNLLKANIRPRREKQTCISPELQVLIALRFYAKGLYQHESADLHGVSQRAVSSAIKKVSIELASHLGEFIRFAENLDIVKSDFYNVAGFPNVIGCIDCTHIKIKNPDKDRPMLYCNRKGFYSLNVQVVCDSKCKITDIVARWRGSAHDARIWDECSLKERLENGELRGILLGDSGYPCSHYLLTPLLNPRTPAEVRYNSSHIRTRIAVERLFGQWKALFRALQIGININLETVKAAIIAMAVVHNIRLLLDKNTEANDINSDSEGSDSNDLEDILVQPPQSPPIQRANTRGSLFRKSFIQRNFA